MKTKVTVWTLASDDDNGTQAAVFLTEREANIAHIRAILGGDDDDEVEVNKAIALYDRSQGGNTKMSEVADGDAAAEDLEKLLAENRGPLDTYSIDSHELEIDIPIDLNALNLLSEKPAPYRALVVRHRALVDKKYVSGLSEAEQDELAEIGKQIDERNETLYAPIIKNLKNLLAEIEKPVEVCTNTLTETATEYGCRIINESQQSESRAVAMSKKATSKNVCPECGYECGAEWENNGAADDGVCRECGHIFTESPSACTSRATD